MITIGILGFGEIGSSVIGLYDSRYQVKISDPWKGYNQTLDNCDVLNICIPFTDKFVENVAGLLTLHKPKLTIIHSTVEPLTTKKIKELTKLPVVHSPVRGIHPYLLKSLTTFVKYIGCEDLLDGFAANKHLAEIGVKSEILQPAATSELLKLLSTTQYGMQIAFAQEMKEMCDYYDVDYYKVVNDGNRSYNDGYTQLGFPQYKRSLLHPPEKYVKEEEPITVGGHCVSENCEILMKTFPDNDGLKFMYKYSKFNPAAPIKCEKEKKE